MLQWRPLIFQDVDSGCIEIERWCNNLRLEREMSFTCNIVENNKFDSLPDRQYAQQSYMSWQKITPHLRILAKKTQRILNMKCLLHE